LKKTLFIIIGIFLLIMAMLVLLLIGVRSENMRLQQVNAEYEYFLNREIYGTELAALINKAIDNNKKYGVEADEFGYYISNETDSILINIQMMNVEEPYQMERIFALGTEQFVELFNSSRFKSESITYHEKTGRIATIFFRQVRE